MNDKELMQQALDALEEACEIVGKAWAWRDEKGRAAANALRARLAQPEPERLLTEEQAMDIARKLADCALMTAPISQIPMRCKCGSSVFECYQCAEMISFPRQREWVGLTKDEVRHIVQGNTDPWCDTPETDGYGVAEMVEAKLREKNETNK